MKILSHMIDSMKMRGPDEQDYIINDNCCLAHSRLSVIDLVTGGQPFTINENGYKIYIIYNGEIYNHVELKKELISYGYKFRTSSDTEVIGKAYLHWGNDFVKKLNGIFAIAIYERNTNTLALYRDRFGVKPLYYTFLRNTIIFASRIDTLFEYPGVKPKINSDSFNNIFAIGPAKSPSSGVFAGVNELLPGHYMIYGPYGKTVRKYFRLKSMPMYDSYEEILEKTEYLLKDSIEKQMLSDVPICTFLSGGVDSSFVTAICAGKLDKPLDTFSFEFESNDKYFQSNSFQPSLDREYVEIMRNYLHSNHTVLTISTNKVFELLEKSVDSRCLPTMADVDSSLLYFCNEVSDTHKVVLTGECADEIFGGYPWFYNISPDDGYMFPWSKDIVFRKSVLNREFAGLLNMEKFVQNEYRQTLLDIDFLPGESSEDKNIRKITYFNIRYFMQTLLDRMDRTSMNCGLEARVPFADHRLVEYVYNIPWKYKFKNQKRKHVLAEVARRYLPSEIVERKKSPYPKTYNPLYDTLVSERAKEVLTDPSSPLRPYLNMQCVEELIKNAPLYDNPWFGQLMGSTQMLAYLIQTDYWMKKYSLSL